MWVQPLSNNFVWYQGIKESGQPNVLIDMGNATACFLADVYSDENQAQCTIDDSGGDWTLSIYATDISAYKRCGAFCMYQ